MNTQITIIGLGLIGGSLAKALKNKCDEVHIIAIDNSQDTLDHALAEGLIDEGYIGLSNSIQGSDFVFIATPVNLAFDYAKDCFSLVKPNCIISDLCSTKGELMQKINTELSGVRFIGGHPMAGSEKHGFSASHKSLFENAYYILVPTETTSDADMKRLKNLILLTGAIPLIMEAQQHDLAVAAISHLPHVAASCLVNVLSDDIQKKLAAGGFRDITRIASSNPLMWQAISMSNKQALSELIDKYMEGLHRFSQALNQNDSDTILKLFESSKTVRDNMDSNIKGLIPNTYILTSDVEDKPGVIGSVANLLSYHGINIKNIAVTNSREYEGGVLNIVFYDRDEYRLAHRVMMENGYRVSDL